MQACIISIGAIHRHRGAKFQSIAWIAGLSTALLYLPLLCTCNTHAACEGPIRRRWRGSAAGGTAASKGHPSTGVEKRESSACLDRPTWHTGADAHMSLQFGSAVYILAPNYRNDQRCPLFPPCAHRFRNSFQALGRLLVATSISKKAL